MKITDDMVERAAKAILQRRIRPDFYEVIDGRMKYDTDKELARAALEAALRHGESE